MIMKIGNGFRKYVLMLILILPITAWSQQTKSIQLKPIYKQGSRYFYDNKRVQSPYALQIPLQSLNDPDINKYYNSFKNLQLARGLAYLPSLIYLFTIDRNSYQNPNIFFYLLLGGLGADLTLNVISQNRMSKSIDLYNISIMDRSSLGLKLDRLPANNQFMLSFGFRKRL